MFGFGNKKNERIKQLEREIENLRSDEKSSLQVIEDLRIKLRKAEEYNTQLTQELTELKTKKTTTRKSTTTKSTGGK